MELESQKMCGVWRHRETFCLGESQFVLFPVKRLIENLECTIEVLVERIKNEVKSESIESFLSLCEIQKETVEMVGTWVGYDDPDTAK